MRDLDIRKSLYNKLKFDFLEDHHTIIINELGLSQGEARIDIALVNGLLHGYEIKSERDNLKRLPFQIEIYNKIFDKITLVTSEIHLEKASNLIPDWWGIVEARVINENVSFFELKIPKENLYKEKLYISQLLWKDELIYILNIFGITKKLSNKTRMQLCEILSLYIDIEELSLIVRNILKDRESWRYQSRQKLNDDLSLLFAK